MAAVDGMTMQLAAVDSRRAGPGELGADVRAGRDGGGEGADTVEPSAEVLVPVPADESAVADRVEVVVAAGSDGGTWSAVLLVAGADGFVGEVEVEGVGSATEKPRVDGDVVNCEVAAGGMVDGSVEVGPARD